MKKCKVVAGYPHYSQMSIIYRYNVMSCGEHVMIQEHFSPIPDATKNHIKKCKNG